jgi:hypothetical protein
MEVITVKVVGTVVQRQLNGLIVECELTILYPSGHPSDHAT